jgi:hypothetical protein
MRRVDAPGEQPARLHHLVPGVMHRRGGVIAGSHQRKLVGEFGVQGKYLGDLDVRVVGFDRLKGTANFRRRVRLHVPGVHLARRAEIENHDARFVVLALRRRAKSLQSGEL